MLGRSKGKANAARGAKAGSSDALEPLLVDYFTRDGSTLTMRLLATSPQIAVGGGYPFEHKYFAYLFRWAQMLDREDWPGKIWNAGGLATLLQEQQMPLIGAPPWRPRELFDAGPREDGMSEYAFRIVWEEFSRRATEQVRKRTERRNADVRYYAEKHLSTWQVDLDRLPPVRIIAVLRDPRDTYVSIMAFTRRRDQAGRKRSMGRQPGESPEAWLERHLARQKERLVWIRQALENETIPIIRYEDLVLNLKQEARRIEQVLDVELDPAAVVADERMRSTHVSAASPEQSIGRWRREMPPELVRRFNDELGDELDALGFDTSEPEPGEREPAAVSDTDTRGR
jgi:hypothetical protein